MTTCACSTPKMERNRKLVTVYRVLGCLPAMVGGALMYVPVLTDAAPFWVLTVVC